jgi:hypothetical protein
MWLIKKSLHETHIKGFELTKVNQTVDTNCFIITVFQHDNHTVVRYKLHDSLIWPSAVMRLASHVVVPLLYNVERRGDELILNCKIYASMCSWHNIPAFACSVWWNPRKPSDVLAALRAGIWIRDLPNTKHECSPLVHVIRYMGYYSV